MKTKRLPLAVAALLLTLGLIGYALAQNSAVAKSTAASNLIASEDEDDETPINLGDAPAAVRAALAKITPDKNVKKVIKEVDDGITTYEVEYEADGKASSVEFSEGGDVLEIETTLAANALPAAVSQAIAKAFPKGSIKEAAAIQTYHYEVVVTVNGKEKEVEVAANGQMDDDDDDKNDDD